MTNTKLVILGGSALNTPAFFAALAHNKNLVLDEVCLVGRSEEKLETVGQFCRRIVKTLDIPTTVTWEDNIKRAAFKAQYILNMIRAGGIKAQIQTRRNTVMSGITGHASKYGEALHNIPPTLDAIREIEAVAPGVIFINFTNPVNLLCEAIATASSITCFGICYHAFSLHKDLSSLLEVYPDQLSVEYFGVNHLGWVTDVNINGHSHMGKLVSRIITKKIKKYHYDVIKPFNLIPIADAFSLYRKGEILFSRQRGIRKNLEDLLFKYVTAQYTAHIFKKKRSQVWKAMKMGEIGILEFLKAKAPWYENCIVPFLSALNSSKTREFIVTWKHKRHIPDLPEITAETSAIVGNRQVWNTGSSLYVPEFAVAWLRQIRDSEKLFIRAIQEMSFDIALEALAIHPNVASFRHAERFLRNYFTQNT